MSRDNRSKTGSVFDTETTLRVVYIGEIYER